MFRKILPEFCFMKPTVKVNVGMPYTVIRVVNEPSRIQTTFRQELNVLDGLTNQIMNEIVFDANPIFYNINENGDFRDVFNRWVGNTTGPLNNWFDLMPRYSQTRPFSYTDSNRTINWSTHRLTNTEVNYTILPNEEGWYSEGIFDSLLIKTNMKSHKFLIKMYQDFIKNRLPHNRC